VKGIAASEYPVIPRIDTPPYRLHPGPASQSRCELVVEALPSRQDKVVQATIQEVALP